MFIIDMGTKTMARKSIAELEQQVEEYKELLDQTTKRNAELVQQADEGFEASALYQSMQKELDLLHKYEELNRNDAARARSELQNASVGIKAILDDNNALSANIGIDYWIGISKPEEYADCTLWQSKYNKATAEIEILKESLQFLREYIREELYKEDNTEVVDIVQPQGPGRKTKIDADLVQRVKEYKRKKYTVRKIADLEGISIGLVQKIIKM